MTDISLKEYFENQLKLIDKAREIQAHEYERRLEFLNGEAGRSKEERMLFVTKATNDIVIASLQKEIKELQSFKDNLLGRMAVIALISSMVGAVITGLIIWTITGG